MTKILRRIVHAVYGLWFVTVFALCACMALIAVLLPSLALRQTLVTFFTRVIFWLTGTGPSVSGREHLPAGQCMIVANHASYLDGPVMTAVLPPRFSFLIKAEMNKVPLAGFLLRRIDSFFADRSGVTKSATAARQVMRAAKQGRALGVFPEGTFTEEPGLKRFQKGAFSVAKSGGLPIIPVVIEGTRHILPADSWWPKPGRIRVKLLPAVVAESVERMEVIALRDHVRALIADALSEPDLLEKPADSTVSSAEASATASR
ncbi:MAG: lysophospholipid acyltransferase family protein [Pseudomonadota bacterium]